jgi:hypothetical protein
MPPLESERIPRGGVEIPTGGIRGVARGSPRPLGRKAAG